MAAFVSLMKNTEMLSLKSTAKKTLLKRKNNNENRGL